MMVEKVVEKKEPTDLQDLKQQIESLATIMKSAMMGNVRSKKGEGFHPQRRKKCFEILLRRHFKDHPGKEKGFLSLDRNL